MFEAGLNEEGLEVYRQYQDRNGASSGVIGHQVYIRCVLDQLDPALVEQWIELILTGRRDLSNITALQRLLDLAGEKRCAAVTEQTFLRVAQALLDNEQALRDRERQFVLLQLADYYLSKRNIAGYMTSLDQANDAYASHLIPIRQALIMLDAGRPDTAREYLELARSSPMRWWRRLFLARHSERQLDAIELQIIEAEQRN